MFRNLFSGIVLLILCGCASTSSIDKVGGYQNNMATGLQFQYQYFYTFISTDQNGKLIETESLFKTDQNEDLPSNIVKLKIGMLVINPHKQKFEVWENLQFINLETDKIYLKHKKLRYQSQLLPEEIVYLDLPLVLEEYTQVIFSVDILTESGELLYDTYKAEYKIGSTNN